MLRSIENQFTRYTVFAAFTSFSLNVVLYFLGMLFGWIPQTLPLSTRSFGLLPVIMVSILPVIAFGMLMSWLDRIAPHAAPLFSMIVMVLLVIAVAMPYLFRDIDIAFRIVLVTMHAITAGSILLLTQASHRQV